MFFSKAAFAIAAFASQIQAIAVPDKELYDQSVPQSFLDSVFAIEKREASYSCHALCGYMILAAQSCGSGDSYDTDCYCSTGSFAENLAGCYDCGWCLWDDYSAYLEAPLAACGFATTPTGTSCLASSTSSAADSSSTESSSEATTTSETSSAETTATLSSEVAASSSNTVSIDATPTSSEVDASSTNTSSVASAATSGTTSSSDVATTEAASSSEAVSTTEAASSSEAAATTAEVTNFSGAANNLKAAGAFAGFVGAVAFLI